MTTILPAPPVLYGPKLVIPTGAVDCALGLTTTWGQVLPREKGGKP